MDIFNLAAGKRRLLIIGGGFAGLEVAKHIDDQKFEVVLLDRHNYFTFQPLLYQVATGGLEPDSVAYPIRKIISNRKKKIAFRMAEVEAINPSDKMAITSIGMIPFTHLIIAIGSLTNFFGMTEVMENALSLKSITDALDIRSFVLQNFERALLSTDEQEKKRLMHFVVVGGGPTGVEIAGSLAELKKHVLPNDYPELDLSMMEITIVESGKNTLSVMSPFAQRNSKKQLEEIGVQLLLEKQLVQYDGFTASLKDGTLIETSSLFWTAGVKGNTLSGFSPDVIAKGNRFSVDEYFRLNGFENIFAIGDVAAVQSGVHPMLGSVAVQQGKRLAKNLNRNSSNEWKPFRYKDRGTMATIGRSRAVADLNFTHLKGFPAWLAWLFIHLMLLVGFRNRLIVLINWIWNYFSYDKAIRLIIRPYKKKS